MATERILRPDKLIVDELTEQLDQTRQLLQGDAGSVVDSRFQRFEDDAATENAIASDLAERAPLANPERFQASHVLAVHALEVLERHGDGGVRVAALGPLRPVVRTAVGAVAAYITKSFAASILDSMLTLYTRRESQAAPGSPERRLLARARVETGRLRTTYGGGGIGLPVLVAAGAAVPAVLSSAQVLGQLPIGREGLILALLGALFVFMLGLSWSLFRGARLAHRRSRLIMGRPLAALWETIGNAGEPPKDGSLRFGALAVILPIVAWIAVPAGVAIVLVVS